mgnify:CR=1 FL=1
MLKLTNKNKQKIFELTMKKRADYGVKRDYRKIDLYASGKYMGSTSWAKSLSEALARYLACDEPCFDVIGDGDLIAEYSKL